MELHKILVGVALSFVIMFGFVFFIAEGVDKYNPSTIPSDYNTSYLGKITDNMDSLTSVSQNTSSQTNLVGSTGGSISDYLGFFFGQAYKAGQVFIGGLGILNAFSDVIIEKTLGSNPLGGILKSVVLVLVLIITLAFLLHFVIKSDRV